MWRFFAERSINEFLRRANKTPTSLSLVGVGLLNRFLLKDDLSWIHAHLARKPNGFALGLSRQIQDHFAGRR